MALFVYVTDLCESDAAKYGLVQDVERFRTRVEATQSLSLFDPFPPPYLVKKKLGARQSRLIADRREVGEHAVIVLLAILIRGSHEYAEFVEDPHAFGAKQFGHLVTPEQVGAFVTQRTQTSPIPPKPDPNEYEYGLLYEAFTHHEPSRGDLVCETTQWVERITHERFTNKLILFCKPCLEALSLPAGLNFVPVKDKEGWGVWTFRKDERLLLLTPATDTMAQESEDLAKRLAADLENADATAILRASRRVYPPLILADEDLWMDLEKEPVANMALSPEESEVLESARRSNQPFPLFINGRAGSGKSTILQYLFADLLFYYLTKPGAAEAIAPPIYLTANPELLRLARTFVTRLLQTEATFSQRATVELNPGGRAVLDEAFREFQPYLLSLVPADVRAQFPAAGRVGHARFRQLWLDRFGREHRALRDFGPDLSWHVIRSYVKGMSSETTLEPDDYKQLPQNQITVTQTAFEQVYERVWDGWYKGIRSEDLWDDQDLTRFLLDNDLVRSIYPAVLCDEAQDFTRVELELLLRLNLFSDRSLPPSEISRVPFAFAGDQFQTLNPTGFRWDTIKASFVEKFIFELDPARRSGRTDLNYRELEYNYRSTHKIVRFCNEVQAMRAALFELPDLRPQTPWALHPQSFPVTWFRSRQAEFWEKFRANGSLVVIVPCSEGEETAFVQEDQFLREHVRTEDGVPLNVLSAARAKGCEYPSVVVYGFGRAAPDSPVDLLRANVRPDADESLPLQYFINSLYVAVSRAKRRLIIVDTDEGLEKLWSFARDEGIEAEVLAHVKNGVEVWGQLVEGMTVGNAEDLTRESAGDPLENAKLFEADGLARQDGFLLRQAALAYRSAGDQPKARECRARAFEADQEMLAAGEAFFDAGFVADGVRCLWRAGEDGWSSLRDQLARSPEVGNYIEYRFAKAVTAGVTAEDALDLLRLLIHRLDSKEFASSSVGDPLWSRVVERVLGRVTSSGTEKSSALLDGLLKCVGQLEEKGIKIAAGERAELLIHLGRTAEAVAAWDASDEPKPTSYHRARAKIEPYPQRILSLAKLKLPAEIIEAYSAEPDVRLDAEQAAAVVNALVDAGHVADAIQVAWTNILSEQMLHLALLAWRREDLSAANSALQASVALMVRNGTWDALAKLVGSGEFRPSSEWQDRRLQDWVRKELESLRIILVRALARSAEFVDAPSKLQRQIADFLRGYLRAKEQKWQNRIAIPEAGAAIERGGRFTDAIVFYESFAKDKASNHRDFARERWVLNKRRQLEHERSQNAQARVADIEREISKALSDWKLGKLEQIPPFPTLSPLVRPGLPEAEPEKVQRQSEATAPPVPVEDIPRTPPPDGTAALVLPGSVVATLGSLKCELSREMSRCNLTNQTTMETAFIKIRERVCGGEPEFQAISETRWQCPVWGLAVDLPVTSGEPLIVELVEQGIQLRLRVD